MRLVPLVVLIAWLPSVGFPAPSIDDVDCSGRLRTGFELAVCSNREAQEAARVLALLVDQLSSGMEVEQAAELIAIDEQWRQLRDRDCTWEAGFFEGGSIAGTIYSSCVEARNRERIDRLKVMLCEGHGTRAPCRESEALGRE